MEASRKVGLDLGRYGGSQTDGKHNAKVSGGSSSSSASSLNQMCPVKPGRKANPSITATNSRGQTVAFCCKGCKANFWRPIDFKNTNACFLIFLIEKGIKFNLRRVWYEHQTVLSLVFSATLVLAILGNLLFAKKMFGHRLGLSRVGGWNSCPLGFFEEKKKKNTRRDRFLGLIWECPTVLF